MNSKTVLITGASKGLGKHLSKRFWEAGYSLILCVRDISSKNMLSSEFLEHSTQSLDIFVGDISIEEDLELLCNYIKHYPKPIYSLINNAAIQGPIGALVVNNLDEWQKTMQVNLLAPVRITQAALSSMVQNGDGSIINISGGGAVNSRPNFSAYATSKAGLIRFSECIADEASKFNISVNCIAPGAMQTELLQEVLLSGVSGAGEGEFLTAKRVCKEGGASMDRVADLALFLASDKGRPITGKLISAVWDQWQTFLQNILQLRESDVYTMRRIVGKDRGFDWGDK